MIDPDIYRRIEELERWRDDMASVERLVSATGSWTPSLAGSSGNPTVTYTTQTGRYTRHGQIVTCWGRITLNTVTATGLGALQITGLPFTSLDSANVLGMLSISYLANVDLGAGALWLTGFVEGNSTIATLIEPQDNAAPDISLATRLAAGDDFVFTMIYPIG